MRRIGIVGGLSPESTVLYYNYIIKGFRERFRSEKYPEVLIYSVSFGRVVELMRSGDFKGVARELLKAVKSLAAAGADFALIAANTPHIVFNEVSSLSPIPMVSIVDALAEALKRDGITKVGLLGTKLTLTKPFYVEGLRKHEIYAVIPSNADIEVIDEIIFKELTLGIVKESSKDRVKEVIKGLVSRGAQAVALACTELPLLIKGKYMVKLYDTARIHAEKALELATA